ncbi:hypothetical protein [Pandoravirus japonicus]|uniref:Uncharacterized protein n=1 Tax=Pandoravirus japonicus TaxID=2823154 RepID=A0A811BR89_9VIRU|nr:hypothetical protein [Pandoravirus japonicus]
MRRTSSRPLGALSRRSNKKNAKQKRTPCRPCIFVFFFIPRRLATRLQTHVTPTFACAYGHCCSLSRDAQQKKREKETKVWRGKKDRE